jgi:chromosome segregation ATPase
MVLVLVTQHRKTMMQVVVDDFDQLLREHAALLRAYGDVQVRCNAQIREQAREIELLEAQSMLLRAELIKRDTALAWAREDRAALEQAIPGLPKRVTLARHVEALQARVRELMDELQQRGLRAAPANRQDALSQAGDLADLEADLAAADLVICQTGCLSHGAYWRVQDHCKRTGKACVLVENADALHIVRIQRTGEGEEAGLVASQQR